MSRIRAANLLADEPMLEVNTTSLPFQHKEEIIIVPKRKVMQNTFDEVRENSFPQYSNVEGLTTSKLKKMTAGEIQQYCWNRYPKSQADRDSCYKALIKARDEAKEASRERTETLVDIGIDKLRDLFGGEKDEEIPDIVIDDQEEKKPRLMGMPLGAGIAVLSVLLIGAGIGTYYLVKKAK